MRPFSVIEPTTEETPVVVEIPHAGLLVDGPTLALLAAPATLDTALAYLEHNTRFTQAPASPSRLRSSRRFSPTAAPTSCSKPRQRRARRSSHETEMPVRRHPT